MREQLKSAALAPVLPLLEAQGDGDLREQLALVLAQRWLIAGTAVATLIVAGLYAGFTTPVFRADVLLQVEEKNGGLGALAGFSSALGAGVTGESSTAAEIEIVRSRSLIGAVVDDLALDVEARPRHIPLIGEVLARRHDGAAAPVPPIWGLSQFAWGGERLRVTRLTVPASWQGRPLRLVAEADGRYRLLGPEGAPLLEGRSGEPADAETAGGRVLLLVEELRARAGTEFLLVRLPRDAAISRLQSALRIQERGKNAGILEVALEGEAPELLAATLNAIARAAREQNVVRRNEEAEKTLEFVNSQLPVVKSSLEGAEKALSEFRAGSGTVDAGLAAQNALQQVVEVEKQLMELQLSDIQLRQRFAPGHPALLVVGEQRKRLHGRRALLGAFMRGLPGTETRSLQLVRDVQVANELYVVLLKKAQELTVVKSGTQGSVHVLDTAIVPRGPVKPRVRLALMEGLVAGLLLGLALALVRQRLDPGEQDPDRVEQRLGIPVFAAIPHSDKQDRMARRAEHKSTPNVLAVAEPFDPAIESLRSLRTSLQFALQEASNNVVCIGGPTPSVGKSFVALNFAHVLAADGRRVLLVDADIRRGELHRTLGLERSPGLVEVVRAEVPVEEAIRTLSPTLSLLTAGAHLANPFEYLTSERFKTLIAELSKQYDLVLLDAPPVLSVADATHLGQLAGVNLVVLRAGRHPLAEIALTVRRLEQAGVRPNGFVFNDMAQRSSYYGYYAYR